MCPGAADGTYGATTAQAVKAFQTANGLTADGIAAAGTIASINTALANSTSASTETGTPDANSVPTDAKLQLGSKGADVIALQKALTTLGYRSRSRGRNLRRDDDTGREGVPDGQEPHGRRHCGRCNAGSDQCGTGERLVPSPVVCSTTAAITTAPPATVVALGCSEMHDPDPEWAEDDLEQGDEGDLRSREEPCTDGEEGETEPHLPEAEDDEQYEVVSGRSRSVSRTAPRRRRRGPATGTSRAPSRCRADGGR